MLQVRPLLSLQAPVFDGGVALIACVDLTAGFDFALKNKALVKTRSSPLASCSRLS